VSRQKLRIKETVQITAGDLFFIGLQIAVASVFLAAPSYYSNAGIYVFGIGCAAYTSLVISLVFEIEIAAWTPSIAELLFLAFSLSSFSRRF
jgi:hypothetical protein